MIDFLTHTLQGIHLELVLHLLIDCLALLIQIIMR